MDVNAKVDEIAKTILAGNSSDGFRWKENTVMVEIGKVIPEGTSAKQTTEGRRRRFREALEAILTANGWKVVRPNVFARPIAN